MNSETRYITKFAYIEVACEQLLKIEEIARAHPKIMSLQQQASQRIFDIVAGVPAKKKASWLRVAQRTLHSLGAIVSAEEEVELTEMEQSGSLATPEEGARHSLSIITQMLDDMSLVPGKAHLVDTLWKTAYEIEDLIPLPPNSSADEDTIRIYAGECCQEIYTVLQEDA